MDLWSLFILILFCGNGCALTDTILGPSQDDLLLSLACSSKTTCGQHLLNCQPDGVVKVKGAIHGYKAPEVQPSCQLQSRDVCVDASDPCCKYNNSSDCLQLAPQDDLDLLFKTCEGRGHCLFRSQHVMRGACDVTEGYSPFSAVAYACVNKSLLLNPTDDVALAGQEVHIFYSGRSSILPEQEDAPEVASSLGNDVTTNLMSSADSHLSNLMMAEDARLRHVSDSQESEMELLDVLLTTMADTKKNLSLSSFKEDDGQLHPEVTKMRSDIQSFLTFEFRSGFIPQDDILNNPNQLSETSSDLKMNFSSGDLADNFLTNSSVDKTKENSLKNVNITNTAKEEEAENLDTSTEQSHEKVDTAKDSDLTGDLFNPGEGYKCQVTSAERREHDETGSGREEEVAVSVIYLRLVGTRGCTKVSVADRTQRASFKCARDQVTKQAGRQLNTMVTPLDVNMRLGASIWEDDFIWIKFTSVTGGPLSLHCQPDESLVADADPDEIEIDWFAMFTGLVVTGSLFFIFFLIAVCCFIHKRRSFVGSGSYNVKPKAEKTTTDSRQVPATPPPQFLPAPDTAAVPAALDTDASLPSSSATSQSPPPSSQIRVSCLPPLPPIPPLPERMRRSVPAPPTRPPPVRRVSRVRVARSSSNAHPKYPGPIRPRSHVAGRVTSACCDTSADRFSTYSPFHLVTDLDVDTEPEAKEKEHAQCTTEEDGDSIDSTIFEFDSFAASDASDNENDAPYDHLHSHVTNDSVNNSGSTYDHTH